MNNYEIKKAVYTVEEIKTILGMGINQTYALIKSNVFPVRKINSKYLIPIKTFEEWLFSNNAA